jgi:hypothetical protein
MEPRERVSVASGYYRGCPTTGLAQSRLRQVRIIKLQQTNIPCSKLSIALPERRVSLPIDSSVMKKVKVKQSLYTPWRRLGGEEV